MRNASSWEIDGNGLWQDLDALLNHVAHRPGVHYATNSEALSLTQSAVSKQVKLLEDAIGKPLFVRGARALSLTPEGRQLYAGTRDALAQLQSLVEQVAQAERQTVAISVTPSFASLWLAPKLAAFRAQHPAIDLRIDAAEDNASLEREGLDLAVRLAAPEQAAAHWKPLAQERTLLVAAPALARRIGRVGDLAAAPLLVFPQELSTLDPSFPTTRNQTSPAGTPFQLYEPRGPAPHDAPPRTWVETEASVP